MTNLIHKSNPLNKINFIKWILLLLMPLVGMVVDLVAPSLPEIAKNLGVNAGIVQNLISLYIIGYAIGGFIMGFLSDALGRKWLLQLNLTAFIVASFIPVFMPYISILLIVRLIQGITIGASSVIARSMISDILTSEELVKTGATIGIMWGIGPVLGPVIGSQLQVHIGWQACFVFFGISALIQLCLIIFFVPETHLVRKTLKISQISNDLREILGNKAFVGLVIIMGLMYSLVASFHTVCPFLIQNVLGYSPLFFGHVAFILGVIFLSSSLLCRYMLGKFDVNKFFSRVITLFLIIITLCIIVSYIYPLNTFLLVSISALMFCFSATLYPLSMGKGMSMFKHIAGAASAVMFCNVVLSSLTSFILSLFKFTNIIALVWVYFLLVILTAVIYQLAVKSKT